MDQIERLGDSIIQHGPASDRIYLMKLKEKDLDSMPGVLINKARQHGYGKVFCKCPEHMAGGFLKQGYVVEAEVPCFYSGQEPGIFLGYYLDTARQTLSSDDNVVVKKNLKLALDKADHQAFLEPASQYRCHELKASEADALATLYRAVFESYPFPIFSAAYLRDTMETHIRYFGVLDNSVLVAAASAEMDEDSGNVEMTDFATLPSHRGRSMAQHLLAEMESALSGSSIQTAYTIARALSAGMNITFSKAGYRFGGTLINNTQISGRIEPMNVWYKALG